MVSDHSGYAVAGRSIAKTVDGTTWATLYGADDDLSFVDAVDAAHAWAVGAHSVFVTTDGGAHWDTRSTAPYVLSTVHFVDAEHGWAVGDASLLRTDDGGRTWHLAPAPCPVDRVCFNDAEHGWLAARVSLYRTGDGGAHWSRALVVKEPSSLRGVATDVQCTPAGDAWVQFDGNNCGAGTCAYVGYRCTSDGVCVVIEKNVDTTPGSPAIPGPGSTPGPFSVIDDHTAVFAGFTGPIDNPVTMMLLSDDGRTSGPVHAVPDGPGQPTPFAVSFTSRERGWLVDGVAGKAHILATTDGGKTWTVQYAAPIPG